MGQKVCNRFIILGILQLLSLTKGLSLDEFGQYKIVVAVDERTVQNSVANYTDIIKMGIQDLSDLLHYSTNGKFSISHADILLPDHWDVVIDGAATTQFYEGADLKISHIFSLPHVDNPNPCGFPGRDIKLPYNFFDEGDTGNYGRLGKALLTQFARLRFGVWEEHGYPGDNIFPYYYKALTGSNWEINACTDAPIVGSYKNIEDGSPCGPEGPDYDPEDTTYPPPSDCRFYPHTTQNATSSLMSYHYLPTFESFCNFNTHDRSKPTPQNFYCRYQSVMEVIQETPDWKKVTQNSTVGRINFSVVKRPKTPLLYILLDAGITQVPESILTQLSSRLSTFITKPQLRNIVAVGQFPKNLNDSSGEIFTELIPWLPVRNNTEEFVEAFQTRFGIASGFKNYAGALKHVIMHLNERKHEAGAAILVVKTGPEPNTGDLTSESEVMVSLLLGNVQIFAVEVHANPLHSEIALQRVVEASGGLHVSVKNSADLNKPLDDFFANLTSTLQSPISRPQQSKYIIGMDNMANNRAAVIVQSTSRISQFQIFVMPLMGDLSGPVLLIQGDEGNHDDIELTELAWDSSTSVPGSRKNYYYSSNDTSDAPLDSLHWQTLSVCGTSGSCRARVVVLLLVEDVGLVPQDITLKMTTSAIDNVVDFATANAGSNIGAAFAIYAKLEQDGIPIQSTPGLTVTAIIKPPPEIPDVWALELKDNGNAAPDISVNDGIFSGAFVPMLNDNADKYNGPYKIFVTVKYVAPPNDTTTTEGGMFYENDGGVERRSPSVGKLFPIDQGQIGCGSGYLGCYSKIPEQDFILSSDLESDVQFVNFEQFVPVPTRIIDLVITPLPNNTVNLKWTDPVVLDARFGAQPGDFYEIRHRDNFEDLLFDFDKSENLPQDKLPFPLPPGSRQNVTYPFGFAADRFYGIRTIGVSSGERVWSQISVIVGVNIRGDVIPTTTTTTTTILPTTVTTLPPITTPPGSTTPEEEITSTVTSPRTTLKRSTTSRPPSTTTPTTRPPVTQPPTTEQPTKHWFKTKEGIITLSVFGGAVLLLSISGGGFYIYLTKYR